MIGVSESKLLFKLFSTLSLIHAVLALLWGPSHTKALYCDASYCIYCWNALITVPRWFRVWPRNNSVMWKLHWKPLASVIFPSRWTFEVLWYLSTTIPESLLKQLHLGFCLKGKFLLLPCSAVEWAWAFVVLHEWTQHRNGNKSLWNAMCFNV